jgi:hypothetical protein
MPDDRAQAPAAKVAGIARRHPCVGLAVAVVRDGEATFSGHGLADIARGTPVRGCSAVRCQPLPPALTCREPMMTSGSRRGRRALAGTAESDDGGGDA